MPYSHDHKQQSRERILQSAARLFTRRGFEGTSINEIMADARLTRGAFYAHFKSKHDLYAQAISGAPLFSPLARPKPEDVDQQAWLLQLVSEYLSMGHINEAEMPCPLAFLITDVALNDREAREAYTEVFLKMSRILRMATRTGSRLDRERVMAITSMMIGGVAIARTLTDEKAQLGLLRGCRRVASELISERKL
ncbi:MAG: TetR/AcrR family transcriptional regulator [Chromatiales bacterium]|nr:TetR/AcrR family transcriptional regulator [Chromatiales bacterium]